VATPVKQEH